MLRPFPEWEDRVAAFFTTRAAAPGAAIPDGYHGLNLGFRSGGPPEAVASNWRRTLAESGLERYPYVMPRMVHGDAWTDADALPEPSAPPREGFPAWEPEGSDAVAANRPGRVLAVTMADCLTALIWDPGTGAIAAVHAGWRGTRAGILAKVLTDLSGAGRIRMESVLVAFGPCLRRESLEVGADVAATLDGRFLHRREGRIYFDMPAANRGQALACGIGPDRIRDLGGDTLGEPERYFSYRRDGPASGRLAAVIASL